MLNDKREYAEYFAKPYPTVIRLGALLIMLGALGLGASCATTKDYGAGKCREYTPVCLGGGDRVCETDRRGCRVCTCGGNPGPAIGPFLEPR